MSVVVGWLVLGLRKRSQHAPGPGARETEPVPTFLELEADCRAALLHAPLRAALIFGEETHKNGLGLNWEAGNWLS